VLCGGSWQQACGRYRVETIIIILFRRRKMLACSVYDVIAATLGVASFSLNHG